MTEDELRQSMEQRFQAMSLREWCRLTGCHAGHISEFIKGKRGPPSDLLAALNLQIRYVRGYRTKVDESKPDRDGPGQGSASFVDLDIRFPELKDK